MSKKEDAYRYRNIVSAVTDANWLCLPTKLEQIKGFLELKATGVDVTEEEVQGILASAASPYDAFRGEDGQRIDVDGIRYISMFGVVAPRMNLMMRFSGGTSTQQLINEFKAAAKDDSVKTVLFHVDSPGGVATMVPELGDLILELRKTKRVVTVAEGMMASAALWVGTAASEVYASTSTEVGSQGAYRILMSQEAANSEAGVDYRVIRAGEFKALGNEYEKISDKVVEEYTDRVAVLNDQFISAMAENRGVTTQFVTENFGRGKVFYAEEAKQRNLIDGIKTFEEVFEAERSKNARARTISLPGASFMTVTAKVKAALFANDCVDSIDASDEVCTAYLRGFAKSNGLNLEDADEAAVISAISGTQAHHVVTGKETTVGIDDKGNEYKAEVLQFDPEQHISKSQADAELRARNAEIKLAAKELNVPDSLVAEALTSNKSIEDIREEFQGYAADDSTPVIIVGGTAQQDKVAAGFVGTILSRAGEGAELTQDEKEYSKSMADLSFVELAQVVNASNGIKRTGDKSRDARNFLASGLSGVGQSNANVIRYGESLVAGEASYNRAGDHPDALSNIMGRMMDVAYDQAETTYETYSKKVPDLPDDRPQTFFETAVFQELDARGEDEKHAQLKFDSQMKAMIQVAKYGNKVALTEEMIIRDDMSLFDSQLATLQEAAIYTVDNSLRALLVSNPNMLEDSLPMFSSARGNLVTSGGPPTAGSASTMRQMHRKIKGYGSTRVMNRPPTVAFLPAEHEEAAHQVFLTNSSDAKVAQTDATINTVRGTITPVFDAMLGEYTASGGDKAWYTIVPKYKPFIYGHLRGKGGSRGYRTTWADPDTGTRYVAIDMWAGYAALNWRGCVKNPGE